MFEFNEEMLPATEYADKHEVTLPLHPMIKEEEVGHIANCVKEIIVGNKT